MAPVAKLGLRLDEQEFLGFRVVRRMAGNAAHIVLRVDRVERVHMLGPAGVAGQAAIVDILRGSALEREDLGYVTATRHVLRSRAMARFAALVRRAAPGIERRLPVRRLFPVVVNVFVAGFAHFRPHVLSRGGVLRIWRRCRRRFRAVRFLRLRGNLWQAN